MSVCKLLGWYTLPHNEAVTKPAALGSLKEHEASIVPKNQEMCHQSILALIFGNNALTSQCLDSLSNDTNDFREFMVFPK